LFAASSVTRVFTQTGGHTLISLPPSLRQAHPQAHARCSTVVPLVRFLYRVMVVLHCAPRLRPPSPFLSPHEPFRLCFSGFLFAFCCLPCARFIPLDGYFFPALLCFPRERPVRSSPLLSPISPSEFSLAAISEPPLPPACPTQHRTPRSILLPLP